MQQAPPIVVGPQEATIRVDVSLYGEDALLRAAHRLTDRCGVQIERGHEGEVLVRLARRQSLDDLERLAQDFLNELLDQTLRARIRAETEPVRRLLIAQAFSSANLLNPPLDDVDPESDPLQIGMPDRG